MRVNTRGLAKIVSSSALAVGLLVSLLLAPRAQALEVPNVYSAVSAASDTKTIGPFACSAMLIKVWSASGPFSGTVTISGLNTNASGETATPLHAVITTPLDGSEMYGIYPAPRYVKVAYTRVSGTLSVDLRCTQ